MVKPQMRHFIRFVIVIPQFVRLYVEIIQELSTKEAVHYICNSNTTVCRLYVEIIQELSTNEALHKNCNSKTTVFPPVCGNNPGALAGGLTTNEAVHSNTTVCPPVCSFSRWFIHK